MPLAAVPELKSLLAASGSPPAVPPLVPPPRFGLTDFGQYRPQHASQQEALQLTRQLAADAAAPRRPRFALPWQRRQPQGHGLYLDGSFGVGKTHLLAATFNTSAAERKAYLSFQELVWLVGVQGLQQTREFFSGLQLLCLDEFELDDPGNTLIVRAVLQFLFEQGTAVLTTSNTPPDAQGEGRFDAEHFRREIQSIAERFTIVPLVGPDYRQREEPPVLPGDAELLRQLQAVRAGPPGQAGQPFVQSSWSDLFAVLRQTHPIGYRSLLAGTGTLFLTGVSTIAGQSDALRFVHFIDKLYDLQTGLRAAGSIGLSELFAETYRKSGYRKKHERCISRLGELLEEPLASTGTVAAQPPVSV